MKKNKKKNINERHLIRSKWIDILYSKVGRQFQSESSFPQIDLWTWCDFGKNINRLLTRTDNKLWRAKGQIDKILLKKRKENDLLYQILKLTIKFIAINIMCY